jgi:hypothetical protein
LSSTSSARACSPFMTRARRYLPRRCQIEAEQLLGMAGGVIGLAGDAPRRDRD